MSLKTLSVPLCLLAFSVTSISVYAQTGSADRVNPGGNMVPMADQHFMDKAAQGGMAEVKLGQLAKEHASNQAVKDFGQRMVDDHSKANDELKSLAGQKNVTLPAEIDARDQATYDHLSKLNGAAFDRAYMRDMVADHRKDIADFQKEANSGHDADVKAWTAKTLPVLQTHLSLAESAEKQVMGTR